MQWTKSKLTANIDDIKVCIRMLRKKYPNVRNVVPSSNLYKQFNSVFGGLFTPSELSYWYRNNLRDLKVSKFYCPICSKPILFHREYARHCSQKCADLDPHKYNSFRKTSIEKFGVENPSKSSQIKSKIKESCMLKYGVENPSQLDLIKAKKAKTCIDNYGVDNPSKNKELKNKARKTNVYRYGNPCSLWGIEQRKKTLKTWNEKYGCKYTQTQQFKDLLDDKDRELNRQRTNKSKYGVCHPMQSNTVIEKANTTKRNSGTFNTSQPEESIYKLLCKSFGKRNVLRQYSSDLYPFNCDFYLPKFDLYMEYNGSWTHGGKPFSRAGSKKLGVWIKKSKKSKYYKIAIDVWTVKDPLKRKVAKQNDLRYIEFWNLDQVKNWLSKYGKAKRFSKGMLNIY